MNKTAKSFSCLLLVFALLLSLGGPLPLRAFADEESPELPIVLRAPVKELTEDEKEVLKLDEDKKVVYEDVTDLEDAFGADSGLQISLRSRPKADDPIPEPVAPITKAAVAELLDTGLFIAPPEDFFIQSIVLQDADQSRVDLTKLAEAVADDASVYLPKEVFEEKDVKELLEKDGAALTLIVSFGLLDKEADIFVH